MISIHQKINWKGNQWPKNDDYIQTMIKRGYRTYDGRPLNTWNTSRIRYAQDRKTNYREPSDSQMGYEGNGEFASNH